MTVQKRVAIITGAAQGIGLAIAKHFATQNIDIALVDLNEQKLKTATKFLVENFDCVAKSYICDVSNVEQISNCVEKIGVDFQRIDIVVNNAGILHSNPIETVDQKQWDDVLAINLKGSFFLIQKSLDFLKKSPCPRIINISSVAGRMGSYESGIAYTASKGALLSMTRSMSRQFAKHNITVNAVCPGTIQSEITQNFNEGALERLLERIPLNRLGKVEDIAFAVSFLASSESGFITGVSLDVNGGMYVA